MKADPERDEICVDGVPIPSHGDRVYLMLNKPRGYVTTLSDDRGRQTAAELVADCGTRVWPVGRLDMFSEGLLVFTNDGEFTQKLEHPSGRIDKEYLVRVDRWDDQVLSRLRGRISLGGQLLAPAGVKLLREEEGSALLSITIHEGKNRQVRRMCQFAGTRVLRLKRVREGCLTLGDLKPGTWRYLKKEEVEGVFGL